jgi:tRNA-splicing ligase RtcB
MNHIRTKELSKIGYTNDQARSMALNIASRHCKHSTREEVLLQLMDVQQNAAGYVGHPIWGPLASVFSPTVPEVGYTCPQLRTEVLPYHTVGGRHIEPAARRQMETAMSLPVTVAGALMPDAHAGYGLPVGGVLATHNAVIPYAVGVDIGCRMALTIIDEPASLLQRYGYEMKQVLKAESHFGMEDDVPWRRQNAIIDDERFAATALLRGLQRKAARQLGTSGGGNHFAEWGTLQLNEDNHLGLPGGAYAALLTHSGSRGLGATIADHYTRIATNVCRLPREARNLAWLDMDTEAGQEYWLSMQLAGDYARACHEVLHHALLHAMGLKPLATVANHHNFAWQQSLADGTPAIVHRKGATPAAAGEPGIIPGSMATPAWLVTGRGQEAALQSAAHGAGRAMSRRAATEKLTMSHLRHTLAAAGVTLVGGSVEEHPEAYKDIHQIMAAQQELVHCEGMFMPRIVRMNKE